MNAKILFILKRRNNYDPLKHSKDGMQTGLYNSATFVHDMLQREGIESKMAVVVDNNEIDREVAKYKPTHVIVEAVWIVPTKFSILTKLHPNVKWIVRLHSDIPFLSQEGMAFNWLGDYSHFRNVIIAANSPRMLNEMRQYFHLLRPHDLDIQDRVIYLPNYYPTKFKSKQFNLDRSHIDIACFGSIRPLKNHVTQVFAALRLAEALDKKLHFHVNGRVEAKGDPVVHNLKGIFQHLVHSGHKIFFHSWTQRDEFLELCAKMDIGMQMSFSETFNIVAADLISQGVPVISSSEVPWACRYFCALPTDSDDMFRKMLEVTVEPEKNVLTQQVALIEYVDTSKLIWTLYFRE